MTRSTTDPRELLARAAVLVAKEEDTAVGLLAFEVEWAVEGYRVAVVPMVLASAEAVRWASRWARARSAPTSASPVNRERSGARATSRRRQTALALERGPDRAVRPAAAAGHDHDRSAKGRVVIPACRSSSFAGEDPSSGTATLLRS